jgi:hypothetical protein
MLPYVNIVKQFPDPYCRGYGSEEVSQYQNDYQNLDIHGGKDLFIAGIKIKN